MITICFFFGPTNCAPSALRICWSASPALRKSCLVFEGSHLHHSYAVLKIQLQDELLNIVECMKHLWMASLISLLSWHLIFKTGSSGSWEMTLLIPLIPCGLWEAEASCIIKSIGLFSFKIIYGILLGFILIGFI